MPAIGLGLKPIESTSIELLFQNANNKIIGGSWYIGHEGEIVTIKEKVEWIVKLGVVFGWKL